MNRYGKPKVYYADFVFHLQKKFYIYMLAGETSPVSRNDQTPSQDGAKAALPCEGESKQQYKRVKGSSSPEIILCPAFP